MRERIGLTTEQTDRAVWTVIGDIRVGGARAVALMLAVAWNTKLPTLPWKVPGAAWLLDRAYEIIATSRHRLAGDTPWCVTHPDACSDA